MYASLKKGDSWYEDVLDHSSIGPYLYIDKTYYKTSYLQPQTTETCVGKN